MPEIEHGQYLLDYAFEIGPSKATANGPAVIDWSDIKAWYDLLGVDLDTWELLVIREISKAFVAQYYQSEGSTIPSPYQPANIDQEAVSQRIGEVLRAMARRKTKR